MSSEKVQKFKLVMVVTVIIIGGILFLNKLVETYKENSNTVVIEQKEVF